MKDRYRALYEARADDYHALVACEDPAGALPAALARICPLDGADVVELGAGTGRVTRLLAARARRVWAFDAARPMLAVAARTAGERCSFAQADHRAIPLPDAVADVAIEGWAFGHLVDVDGGAAARAAVGELRRLLRPGGVAVVIETLSTGRETPRAPSPALAAFYAWLEGEAGFTGTWIRTDYRFASAADAEARCRFFFGDALGDVVARAGSPEVPECTGIWSWRR